MSPDEIKQRWEQEIPLYEEIGKTISKQLKIELPRFEILPDVSYRTKELLSLIKKIDRKSKEKNYEYEDVKDLLGIRVICSFSSDLEIVDKFVTTHFNVIKAEYKKEELAFDKLDYTSNHYDVKINPEKINISNYAKIKDFVFELQVRSINQHAWSNTAHILTYKSEAEIPSALQRKVYRLLSLYEIADDEFSAVNKSLQDTQNNIVYKFIRKLEGKVYKYVQADFDRVLSIYYFNKLLMDFDNVAQLNILDKVSEYVENNNEKLQRVFTENKIRFHNIIVLTQPEIFLIFYMLEKHESILEHIYANELDYDELEILKGIWV